MMTFKDEKAVIAAANDTDYGLAASLFTQDISRAHRVARKLQAGSVWINSSGNNLIQMPFGGYKSSGIGRELGEYGLANYSQVKSVYVNLGND
jgi:aldehyde dehydrogenase (NAD+)